MDGLHIVVAVFCLHLVAFVAGKEPLNITCTLDPMQITVEIFTTRPLYNVQLKNSDRSCDPQEFTANSIKFLIQNYQLGMCGFVRSESSTNGLDGTFWNNLVWKEKPTTNNTKTTKIKCAQKMSSILGAAAQLMPMPVRVQVIHLPFGAFPSAFGGADGMPPGGPPLQMGMGGLGGSDAAGMPASLSMPPPGMISPFPPGISPMGGSGGMIFIRSGPSARLGNFGPSVRSGNFAPTGRSGGTLSRVRSPIRMMGMTDLGMGLSPAEPALSPESEVPIIRRR